MVRVTTAEAATDGTMYEDDFQKAHHVSLLGSLTGHEEPVTAMAWSPDDAWLASTSRDGGLNLWSRIQSGTTPRFRRNSDIDPNPALTSVAWSPDGEYLACGSQAGQLLIWETSGFRQVGHEDGARSAINCVAWGTGPGPRDRRLAFGEHGRVHFRNFRNWAKPDTESAYGHATRILTVAWSPDGSAVVTGTEDGTIGVWRPSQLTNELRILLTRNGIYAHGREHPVTALAFCPATGLLASGGQDGCVCLWDVDQHVCIDALEVEPSEEILDLAFAHGGALIVVQSLHRLRVLRHDPLKEIAVFYYPAQAMPVRSSIAMSPSSRLATIDPADRKTIKVWRVDFDALLKRAAMRSRVYRAAAVSLLGEPGSGRTNLALALTGGAFVREHTSHEFRVHRLTAANGATAHHDGEIREVALWDLPTRVDHALVHRVHAGDGAVALIVLSPIPGTLPTAARNIDRWAQMLRRWQTISRGQRHPCIAVIARADEFARECSPSELDTIASYLKVDRLMIVSAKAGTGIGALRDEIMRSIDWNAATSFPSPDALQVMVAFVQTLRERQRFLTSTRELYDLFVHLHPYVTGHVADEQTFRLGVQLLEVLGHVELFDKRDEVVLDPRYYHSYASAMIAGAERDHTGMGRLSMMQAERGRGDQFQLEEAERLADPKQEERLLALTINELVVCGVAQKVAVDGANHLVFPMSMTRIREAREPRPPRVAAFRFVGPTDDVFSALMVRLLGLKNYYCEPDLWKNEGLFTTASGGSCGIVLEPNEAGDEARLSVHCDQRVSPIERRQFVDMICEHIDTLGRIVGSEAVDGDAPAALPGPEATGTSAGVSSGPVEVFLCWKSSTRNRTTAENVRVIAAQLRDRDIQTAGDVVRETGLTPEEHRARLERSRVALVLMAGPLSTEQDVECRRLEDCGCRMIPVVLPNAPRQFTLPSSLLKWEPIDLRGRFLDTDQLVAAVSRAWTDGPVQMAARGHVFLSYCGADVDDAERLRHEIERAGHAVWWSRSDADLMAGQGWPEDIRDAIRSSYAFLWCLSHAALKRPKTWLYSELWEAIAMQQLMHPARIFIIPVRLSDCDMPDVRIDPMRTLATLHRFDYFERRGSIGGLVRVLDRARREAEGGLAPNIAPS
jgi:WD40 repeat protein